MQYFWNKIIIEFCNLANNWEIHLLTILILSDILTGLFKSFCNGKANSSTGVSGLIKHLLIFSMIIVATPYAYVLGFENGMNIFIAYYIIIYCISITENLGEIGVPFPQWIINGLEKLKNKTDKGEK